MKKQISNLLILLLVFSSLIVSCDDGSDDLDPNICKITVSSSGNGNVSITNYIGTSENVLLGSNVEVVATPDDGCEFLGWFVGEAEEPISTDAEYTFTVSESVTLVAKFAKLQNLTISSDGNGRVSFKDTSGTSKTLLPGSEVTVIATPGENYEFAGWYIGEAEEPISTDAEYTFTVSESVTLVAKFNQLPLVVLSCSGNGTVSFADSAEASQYIQPGSEVTVIATPGDFYEFAGWYIGEAEEPISTDAEYTFTVSENIALVAKFKNIFEATGSIGGYDYVDLGLSVKWASFNVGATKPEEYGGFYAWGETEEKSNYSWSTYKYCNGSYDTMTKYCTSSSYGIVDNKTVLDPEDDVAHVKWGGDWRMPTKSEQEELIDNCTWEWTTLNGVNGYKVTGSNGNSIFLPAAGYRDGADVSDRGNDGYYWSSSLYSSSACSLNFYDGSYDWGYDDRYNGLSVRPVSE